VDSKSPSDCVISAAVILVATAAVIRFIYYPVSAIMRIWYKAFSFALGPANFFAWGLSVMFLVFTFRAFLCIPFVRRARTIRHEEGFNSTFRGLPMLAQIPVFMGLYHVLRSFNRTIGGIGQPHMSVRLIVSWTVDAGRLMWTAHRSGATA
jgi:membrane protein insertase Oxa1/YidC/SpoIIIJ